MENQTEKYGAVMGIYNPIMTEYKDPRNPPLITLKFKQAFNEMLIEISRRQDAEGKFRLTREISTQMYPVLEKVIKLCKQYQEDQQSTLEGSPYMADNFMHLCDVEV